MNDHQESKSHQLREEGITAPTSGSPSPHKRSPDDDDRVSNSSSKDCKRPKVVLDESNSAGSTDASNINNNTASETKTVVTPTSVSASASKTPVEASSSTAAAAVATSTSTSTSTAAAKAAKASTSSTPSSEHKNTVTTTETLDLAETLGLKAGVELEVQWEIHNDATAAAPESNNANANANTTMSLHWWKSTLLEHDGRTTDSVAIRTLLYEARPDLGFPEPSREDVVFLGRDVLATSTNTNAENWDADPDSVNQMPYRRYNKNRKNSDNGDDDGTEDNVDADEVFYYSEDQLEEQLNSLLMGAFQKNQTAWNSMPAAQQAMIAEMIQKKKEELKEILRAEAKNNNNQVITSDTIKEILARTF